MIISPEPDICRTFELAFELEGLVVRSFSDMDNVKSQDLDADLLLIDVNRDLSKEWHGSFSFIKAFRKTKSKRVVVLMPRGVATPKPPLKGLESLLFIKRPYDFMAVVKSLVK